MPDLLDELRSSDPCSTEPRFDDDAAQALLRRSLAAPAPIAARQSMPARGRLTAIATAGTATASRARMPARGGIAAAAAVAALAGAIVLGAGGEAPPSARAAVLAAADALPDATNGRVVIEQRNNDDDSGLDLGSARQEYRFSGDDIAKTGSGTMLVDGRPDPVQLGAVRRVDGIVYAQLGNRPRDPDGWQRMPREPSLLPTQIAGPATRVAAQTLVGALTDVRASADRRSFSGTVSRQRLRAAYGGLDPDAVARATAPGTGPIEVLVTVDGDGVLSAVRFTTRGPWHRPERRSVTSVLSLSYSQLGVPQTIVAPETAD